MAIYFGSLNSSYYDSSRNEGLLYRRQFLLGPKTFNPSGNWRCLPVSHNIYLSIHPDLDYVKVTKNDKQIILLGLAVDTLAPKDDLNEIALKLLDRAQDINQIINNTDSLAGRWIVIFLDSNNIYLFTDPCGFRQAFYFADNNEVWCGSQPEVINAVRKLDKQSTVELHEFLMSDTFKRNESAWVGNKTLYRDCYHLLPNHYLNFKHVSQIRFYSPKTEKIEKQSMIVENAAIMLRGSIEGVTNRKKVIQALTAGWDSRVLLAASRDYREKISYYVDQMGHLSERNPDVWVPKQLAKSLGINIIIRNSTCDLPDWFVSLQSKNVSGARVLPKSRIIYSHFQLDEGLVNVNGNGSEICRSFYDKYSKTRQSKFSSSDLSTVIGYPNSPYVKKELEEWITEQGGTNSNTLDMLYWEQRLGNWGAQYPAEQDIAIDEFSPFSCRLLIETLLASPRITRIAPRFTLYRDLINAMWPQALSLPINPPGNFKQLLRQIKKEMACFLTEKVLPHMMMKNKND